MIQLNKPKISMTHTNLKGINLGKMMSQKHANPFDHIYTRSGLAHKREIGNKFWDRP
jgi:hypothetical protein